MHVEFSDGSLHPCANSIIEIFSQGDQWYLSLTHPLRQKPELLYSGTEQQAKKALANLFAKMKDTKVRLVEYKDVVKGV